MLSIYFIPGWQLAEYIETMCPNTLMEYKLGLGANAGKVLFNQRKTGEATVIVQPDFQCENGIYHGIDRPLLYNAETENDVLNKRLRMDYISMFPELVTNKVRGNYTMYYLPPGYIANFVSTPVSQVLFKRNQGYEAMFGDDITLSGKYDFTLRIPPIPAGTYEIRMGFCYSSARGVAQIYFDNSPCGIPLDMAITGLDPRIGWIADEETGDGGVENDKMMRNRGWMKGAAAQLTINGSINARDNKDNLRRIIATRTFERTEPHFLRLKSVLDRSNVEYDVDFIEFMPLHLIATEDKY